MSEPTFAHEHGCEHCYVAGREAGRREAWREAIAVADEFGCASVVNPRTRWVGSDYSLTLRQEFERRASVCRQMIEEERATPDPDCTAHERLEAALKRAEAAEKAHEGCADLLDRHDALKKALDIANSRIENEIAARRLAQEHGIGDRARIEELEKALAERGHAYNCFCCSGCLDSPDACRDHVIPCRDPRCAPETKPRESS